MLTARYKQFSTENIRRVIGLTNWLASLETLSEVSVEAHEDLEVTQLLILPPGMTSYQFYITGGEPGSIYDLEFTAETTLGQVRVDRVQLMVRS